MNKERSWKFGYFISCMIAFVFFFLFCLYFYMGEFTRGMLYVSFAPLAVVFTTFTALFIVLGIINFKLHPNGFGILMNIGTPLSLLNLAVLFKRAGGVGFWCVGAALAVIASFWLPVLFGKKITTASVLDKYASVFFGEEAEVDEEALPLKNIIYGSVGSFFILLCLFTTIAMASLGIFRANYNVHYDTDVLYHETCYSNAEMSYYVKLEGKHWKTLDSSQRLELLQSLAEKEAKRLGLHSAPRVVTSELYNKPRNVSFNAEENLVELDLNTVERGTSGYKSFRALANGIYLAYENTKGQLFEAIKEGELAKYSELIMFLDTSINAQFIFEENALTYSRFAESELRRKILLYKFDSSLGEY